MHVFPFGLIAMNASPCSLTVTWCMCAAFPAFTSWVWVFGQVVAIALGLIVWVWSDCMGCNLKVACITSYAYCTFLLAWQAVVMLNSQALL